MAYYGTAVPAYGRDVKSAKDAKASFLSGDDWLLLTYNGEGYASVRDFQAGDSVQLRYDRKRKTTVVKIPKGGK